MVIVTCIAPVNIAVIKYWGKRCEDLILPLNDSLSATLSMEQMKAKTTIMACPTFKENKIWLNGKEETFDNIRLQNCIKDMRKKAQNETILKEILSWNLHICSENNFPTAAGLASSAAGYACLVYALAQLYSIKDDISVFARRGSGSACRSTLGGWVRWHSGIKETGDDSIARQIATANHWKQMRILILVVNDHKKKTSSSTGMKNSVKSSDLLKYRVEKCVPKRIEDITKAIINKDFETFGKITMQDSNQFHAVCLDTYPPCVYMNDISHKIVELIHMYNDFYNKIKVAYTFDAGPNACLYLLEEEAQLFVSVLNTVFPSSQKDIEYIKGIPVDTIDLPENLRKHLHVDTNADNLLKYIIHTNVGEGPKVLEDSNEHLLSEAGLPKKSL